MTLRLGVVMDPIAHIHRKKDSTFAMLLEAQRRAWDIYYFEQKDLYWLKGQACGKAKQLRVKDDEQHWYDLSQPEDIPLHTCDVILLRKDPPFDNEYLYTTLLLEQAEKLGTLIINKPQSLRDANEKLFTLHFPQCCPETLVSRDTDLLKAFIKEHSDVMAKPLAGMGGQAIFRIQTDDYNQNVILETLTQKGACYIMLQRYIPAIKQGDKRILMINGTPIPYALARIPAPNENRANLAAGGQGIGVALTERDYWICEQLAPTLKAKSLIFVGIDIIGDYLTEINVTSPTCIRELDRIYNLNICSQLFDAILELHTSL